MIRNISKISLVTSLFIATALAEDSNTTKSNWSGELRGGYQYTDDSVNTAGEFGLSTSIKYESDSWNNLIFGVRVTGAIGDGKTPEGIAFFDVNNDGYGIVDELYVKGAFGKSELTIGRQAIDLPFVDTDSGLGLVENRFEAIVLSNKDIKDSTIYLAHVRSWSGVDSDDAGNFNRINGNDGVELAGIEYTGIENFDLKAFGYMANNFVNVGYLEAVYENETDLLEYSTTLQYALQDYDDGTKASIFGIGAELELKNIPLGFNIAYNKNFDYGVADNLFGGGPFVTSMEHYTIAELEGKGDMIKGGLSYEIIDGLTIEANYGKLNRSALLDAKIIDYGLCYEYNNNLGFNAVYSDIKDDQNGDMKNLRAYITYDF
ncbi:MAG: OprD family outer membrane porin [Sulfurovaceae bacterium]|nr:OprD family outer membrane porin [Sulfurovaceae bacterium]